MNLPVSVEGLKFTAGSDCDLQDALYQKEIGRDEHLHSDRLPHMPSWNPNGAQGSGAL